MGQSNEIKKNLCGQDTFISGSVKFLVVMA